MNYKEGDAQLKYKIRNSQIGVKDNFTTTVRQQ
jgi:hypothetical protein